MQRSPTILSVRFVQSAATSFSNSGGGGGGGGSAPSTR